MNRDTERTRTKTAQPDDAPVVNVSYNDATEFCAWLSKKQGKHYRLPTEAEWEYACRAGTVSRYYNGDDPEKVTQIGNVRDAAWTSEFAERPSAQPALHSSDGYASISPVGKFQPNHFGLFDMLGNAWEVCSDWYGEDYYAQSPDRDPTGPPTGTMRIHRGGAWWAGAMQCRAARRQPWPQNRGYVNSGFRIAL
jgi:sulfatase modifying factor 1